MTTSHSTLLCPNCDSRNIARVQFGMPDISDDKLLQDEKDGKIILAGCVMSDSDPHYYCNDCKYQWRRDGKEVEYPIETDTDWLKEALDETTVINDTEHEKIFTPDDPQAKATEADVDDLTEALSSEDKRS